jgi:hypothetical protein
LSFCQSLNANWKQDLNGEILEFKNCKSSSEDNYSCNGHVGQSFKTVYEIDDFYSVDQKRYLVTQEITNLVVNNEKWSELGHAYDENALSKAQENANAKIATIAIYKKEDGIGLHIALILPGDLHSSGSWGFKVPNCASFFTKEHDKSFMGKGLSYAFTKGMIKDVILYSRNY